MLDKLRPGLLHDLQNYEKHEFVKHVFQCLLSFKILPSTLVVLVFVLLQWSLISQLCHWGFVLITNFKT